MSYTRGISLMTAREFEGLSERAVCTISISTLSKTLHPDSTKRETFETFFRWFDIHRKNPTQLTVQWPNVLTHWVQRLASRGFTEQEIAEEVNIWTIQSPPLSSDRRRLPQTAIDINKALGTMTATDGRSRDDKNRDEKKAKREHETNFWRLSDSSRREMSKAERTAHKRKLSEVYEQPPPSNYVCNRCDKKGHHLQVCPTNLDPAYDRPPPSTYICEICDAEGQHFKSLCPRNTDPYSITQKRKSRGIRTPTKGTSQILREWEADTQRKTKIGDSESAVDRDPRKRIKSGQFGSAALERGRLSQEPSSSSPSEKDPLRLSEEVEDLIRNGTKQGDGGAQGHCAGGSLIDYGGIPSSPPVGFGTTGIQRAPSVSKQDTGDFEIDVDTDSTGDIDIEVNKPVKIQSAFVEGLISKRPDMKEAVNPIPRRQTAREMWKDADRQVQEAADSSPAQSPTWEGISSDIENDKAIKNKPLGLGFDGAGDERTDGGNGFHDHTGSVTSIASIARASIEHAKAFIGGLRQGRSPIKPPHQQSPDIQPLCSATDKEEHRDLDEDPFQGSEVLRSIMRDLNTRDNIGYDDTAKLTPANLEKLKAGEMNANSDGFLFDNFSIRAHDGSWYENGNERLPTRYGPQRDKYTPEKHEKLRKLTKEELLYVQAEKMNIAAKRREQEDRMIAARRAFLGFKDSDDDSTTDEDSLQDDFHKKESTSTPGQGTSMTNEEKNIRYDELDNASDARAGIPVAGNYKKATVEDALEESVEIASASQGDVPLVIEETTTPIPTKAIRVAPRIREKTEKVRDSTLICPWDSPMDIGGSGSGDSVPKVKKPALGRLRDIAKSFKGKRQEQPEKAAMATKDRKKPEVPREKPLNNVLRGFPF
ncbi:hypothetical protein BDZ45DRAFT_691103 [Acephala macrosclerotiorum]|nr:hypothetical protein BDZ45DRAFT_691103 [Acephala macrosclerotiorum]